MALHSNLLKLQATFSPSPLVEIKDALLTEKKVQLWVKRDDLLHPIIAGNKWRKLKYILDDVLKSDYRSIVSMGGAWSNHLHALAYCGHLLGMPTSAYVRGEKPKQLTQTLMDVEQWGMRLHFVSRSEYRQLRDVKSALQLPEFSDQAYWLPEGGATELALLGVKEIIAELAQDFDVICTPCGTGTTLAGLIDGVDEKTQVLGFAALKGAGFLFKDVEDLISSSNRHWEIMLDYHFGGFAKTNAALHTFIRDFQQVHQISLEPVYSGKMFYAVFDLIEKGYFPPGQNIMLLHTGGLQGNRGFSSL